MAVFITTPPGNTFVKTAIFIRAVRDKSASMATNFEASPQPQTTSPLSLLSSHLGPARLLPPLSLSCSQLGPARLPAPLSLPSSHLGAARLSAPLSLPLGPDRPPSLFCPVISDQPDCRPVISEQLDHRAPSLFRHLRPPKLLGPLSLPSSHLGAARLPASHLRAARPSGTLSLPSSHLRPPKLLASLSRHLGAARLPASHLRAARSSGED